MRPDDKLQEAVTSKSKARFIDPSEHLERWTKADQERRRYDPSWYLIGLDHIEKTVLDAAAIHGLRFGRPIEIELVTTIVKEYGIDSTTVQQALSRFEDGQIIYIEPPSFRLTRQIDQKGIRTNPEEIESSSREKVDLKPRKFVRCPGCGALVKMPSWLAGDARLQV